MIESFLSVGTQVLILFLMIGTGFVLGKLHLITHKGAVSMSNLLMYVVSPCILIVVFQRPLETETFHNFWVALLAALVIHGINILVSELVIRDRDPMRKSFFRFSAIFSNCGFMAVPLQTAILGSLGVFYGSAYLLVFTVLTWTLGIQLVKGGKMAFSWRTLLMNPGVIGVAIAMVLYLLQITLPEIILSPITYLSDMNTPLPMVVIGYQLSQADFRRALHGASFWVSAALRLVILPLLALGVCMRHPAAGQAPGDDMPRPGGRPCGAGGRRCRPRAVAGSVRASVPLPPAGGSRPLPHGAGDVCLCP